MTSLNVCVFQFSLPSLTHSTLFNLLYPSGYDPSADLVNKGVQKYRMKMLKSLQRLISVMVTACEGLLLHN